MYPRLIQLGSIAIPTFGVAAACALLAALAASVYFARRLALDPNKVWNVGISAILVTLIGSRLLLIAFHLRDFAAHPFWMLGLTSVRSGSLFAGGVLVAACACLGYIYAARLPVLRTLDALAPAVALAFAIASLGSFAAGQDYGRPTAAPWGVVYTSRIAALWSGTPLGVPLYPTQLYECAAELLIFLLLAWWLPRRTKDGELAGAWLFLYGVSQYWIGFYRGNAGTALTTEQWVAVAAVLAGGMLWIRWTRADEAGFVDLQQQNPK